MIAQLAGLIAYNVRIILGSRREFIITPLVIAVVSVTIIPYGLFRYVGTGDIAVVVSTGLIMGAILLPSMAAALYSVMEVSLGPFEKYMLLPVPRQVVVLARIASMALLNMVAVTVALALAAALHGLKITIPVAALAYISSAALTAGITGITLLLAGGAASIERVSLTVSVLGILLADASPILFPLESLPLWAQALLIINPVTSSVEVLRRAALEGRLDPVMATALLIVNLGWMAAGMKALSARLEKL